MEKAYSVIKSSPLALWAILSHNSIHKLMCDPIINWCMICNNSVVKKRMGDFSVWPQCLAGRMQERMMTITIPSSTLNSHEVGVYCSTSVDLKNININDESLWNSVLPTLVLHFSPTLGRTIQEVFLLEQKLNHWALSCIRIFSSVIVKCQRSAFPLTSKLNKQNSWPFVV